MWCCRPCRGACLNCYDRCNRTAELVLISLRITYIDVDAAMEAMPGGLRPNGAYSFFFLHFSSFSFFSFLSRTGRYGAWTVARLTVVDRSGVNGRQAEA